MSKGTFAETKEILGGFNLIEAADMVEAVRIAADFPWAQTGCVEVHEARGHLRCTAPGRRATGDLRAQNDYRVASCFTCFPDP